jgi:hypothetical protein
MASTIKVNNIQNQCGANIANKCGSTITLGASGDTITLACGASQTGFGRTGTVDWDTTAKTSSFTAVSGNGYFVNTTSGAITVTLPATPSAGDIVSIADYAGTAATNNITIARNGSNINGAASDQLINKNNSGITLVYVDGTQGWKGTETSNLNDIETQPEYIVATGGTVTCCGDYKIHTFTGPGTFTVCSVGNPIGSDTVDYLIVAGGAGGGGNGGGGGGAGGFRLSNSTCMPAPLTSPLANPTGIPVTAESFPITVGAGGNASPPANDGDDGSNSIFSTITSTGGGGGGGTAPGQRSGRPGGSAGGGTYVSNTGGGTGNTPPVSPPQGQDGGAGFSPAPVAPGLHSGGGGGASAAGGPGNGPTGGPGGNGSFVVSAGFAGCNGTTGPVCGARYFAGGGAGSPGDTTSSGPAPGGDGGGGPGTINGSPTPSRNGTANTGGGAGGGAGGPVCGGNGGSGIVIIRYKYQ